MLKEFWEAKKHLIQFVGILAGVGALFLTIPRPQDAAAGIALANIQLVWLLILSISTIVLFFNFVILIARWEKDYKKRKNFDLTETFSTIAMLTTSYLIINLWIYIIHIYKDSVFDFMRSVSFGAAATFAAFFYFIWRRIVLKISDKFIVGKIIVTIIAWALLSSLAAAWTVFIQKSGDFDMVYWVKMSAVFFLIFILAFLFGEFRKRYKN